MKKNYLPTVIPFLSFVTLFLLFSLLSLRSTAQTTTLLPPPEAATGTWQTNRGCLRQQGTQYMKGSYALQPVVKWRGTLTSNVNSGGCEGEPAIGDINNDGLNDVVEAVNNGYLMAFNGTTGALIWQKAGVASQTSPVIADADNDGVMDLAVVDGARLYLLDGATGNTKWSFTPTGTNGGNSCPSVADLDHDGRAEVIFISGDACYAIDGLTGTQKWRYATGLPLLSAFWNGTGPAIGDVNGDGIDDVVASLQKSTGGANTMGCVLVALDGATGNLIWSVTVAPNNGQVASAPFPAIGDVNGDCRLDVVYSNAAFRGYDGTVLWGTATSTGAKFCIIADLADNCNVEVVTGCGVKNASTGTTIWQNNNCTQSGWFAPAPKVGDFNPSSAGKEILLGSAYQIQNGNVVANPTPIKMFAGMTGTLLWSYDIATLLHHTVEGMSVGDIDNDGCVEIVVAPDCCNGENSLLALDDSTGATHCGILASIGQVDFRVDSISCLCRDFNDFSSACASNWNWSFPGGTPSSSSAQNPGQVCYTASGTYTVTMTAHLNACTNADTVIHSFVITNCSTLPHAVFTSSDTIFCNETGECINFFDHSTGNPTSWQWSFPGGSPASSTAQNPDSICYYIPGTYQVTLIVSNSGGSDTLSVSPMITFGNPPNPPSITVHGDTLISTTAFSYQWYYGGFPISGATNQTYIAAQSGTYAVNVRDSIGCSSISSGVVVNDVSVNELAAQSFISIYPNPVTDEMFIELASPLKENSELIISDAVGKEIGRINAERTKKKYSWSMSHYSNGIYFIRLQSHEQPGFVYRTRFVVMHK